ncbi:hypothetical protein HPB50_017692 [Hyalomma asiaticum]|uniref:Uncharacterized protein n=1 Tax=Hyalomma asiaticum TaxID=266040 RepID=A0ACB7SID7_HYAAI|nr:hypothetical protein HPB50_017692 [Hyalomma asiaticum]
MKGSKAVSTGDSNSSLVTDSPEMSSEEATREGPKEKTARQKSLRTPTAAKNATPPASTRNTGKRSPHRFKVGGPSLSELRHDFTIRRDYLIVQELSKGPQIQEYHGQQWPIGVKDRSSKRLRQQEQPRKDCHVIRSGHHQAPGSLVEHDARRHVKEARASNEGEEWHTAATSGTRSSACTMLVPRDSATALQAREQRQSAVSTTSEATTDCNAGENPDSLGMEDRHKPNILLFDSSVSHDKSARSTPLPWRLGDIREYPTSPFVPHSRGYTDFNRVHSVSYPESAMDVGSSPRYTELNASLVACVIVIVLLVTLLAVVLFTLHKLRYDDSYTVPDSAREDACFNTACEMVVALLGKSQDPKVPPCKNFHRHVCGRWYAKSSYRTSYVTENRNDFHARVAYNLLRLANATQSADPAAYHMALFYTSCRRFAQEHRTTNVEEVLKASRINAREWLAVTSFHELFATIVAECLRTGLVSVISVKRDVDQGIYVDKGETLARLVKGYNGQVTHFVKDALATLSSDQNSTLAAAIVALDSMTQQPNSPPASEFQTIEVHELPTRSFVLAWVQGLNRGLRNSSRVTGDTRLFVRRPHDIGTVIWTLSSVDLSVASVYSMLLPLAQIMSYAIAIDAQEEVAASKRTDPCLLETAERFRVRFPAWVAQTMETSEVHGYFGVMMDTLRNVASEHPDILEELVLNATDIAELRMNTAYMATRVIPQTVPYMDANNFLANVVILMGQERVDGNKKWHRLSAQQLSGDLSYDGEVLIVSTLYLVGDMLHVEASDPVLDYSTVGVRVLAEWASTLVERLMMRWLAQEARGSSEVA